MSLYSGDTKTKYNSARLKATAIRRACPGCSGKNGLQVKAEGLPNEHLACRYCDREYSGVAFPCTADREIARPPAPPPPEELPVAAQPHNRLMPGCTEAGLAEAYEKALARLTAPSVITAHHVQSAGKQPKEKP